MIAQQLQIINSQQPDTMQRGRSHISFLLRRQKQAGLDHVVQPQHRGRLL
jgi:hypothetical protein